MTSKHLKLIQNLSENTSSNHILYGVSGTGKTYASQQISFE
jgi:Cdc6-like AAA superfamily ATPase